MTRPHALAGLTVALMLAAASAPSWAQRGGDGEPGALEGPQDSRDPRQTTQIMVLLSPTDPAEARRVAETIAQRHQLIILALYPLGIGATLALVNDPAGRAVGALTPLIRQEPQVIDADGNPSYDTQSDPHAPRQYALALVGAERAHRALRGRGVLITVLDTSVDVGHEDLSGAVAARENLIEANPDTSGDAHGTAIAGIIAARRDNSLGIAGMAPEARLVSLRACLPKQTGGTEAVCAAHRVVRGVDRAIQHRGQILNMSLGGPPNRIVARLVGAAITRGVAVVAAGGNNGPDGSVLYPAALPGVIGVSATDNRDNPYERSNLRAHISMLAPGVDIMTTLVGNRYAFVTGTSFAAAHVAGGLALLVEAASDVPMIDVATALKTGAVSGPVRGIGRVDLCRSLVALGKPEVCR